jgi:3-(3-hydroxy-phenyl)propionate hydroxylase
LVNSGRLSVATHLTGSALNTPDTGAAAADGAVAAAPAFAGWMSPGAPLDDAPVRMDGRDAWLLRQIDGFTVLAFGNASVTPADLAGLPVPVRLLRLRPAGQAGAGEIEDVQGLAQRRLDARDGTVYLLRPDQHVAARWRAFGAAAVRQALGRALCRLPTSQSSEAAVAPSQKPAEATVAAH